MQEKQPPALGRGSRQGDGFELLHPDGGGVPSAGEALHLLDAAQPRREEAHEPSAKYRDMYDAAPIGFLAMQEDGTILQGNRTTADLLEVPVGEMPNANMFDFVAESSKAELQWFLERVFAADGLPSCELELAVRGERTRFGCLEARLIVGGTPPSCRAFLTDITERKRAVLALERQSEELRQAHEALQKSAEELRRLSLVAKLTTNAVVITDAEGCIQWVNDGFTRITEYTLAEVVGKKPGHLLQGPDTDPREVARIRESLMRGEGIVSEILNYAKSGRTYWLRLEIQPVYSETRSVDGYIAVETEITREREHHDALEQAVARLRLAVDAAGIGFWDRELPSQAMFCDDGICKIFGLPAGAPRPTYTDWSRLIHPDDRDVVARQLQYAHAWRTKFDIPYRIVRDDGTIRHVRSRGLVMPARILGVLMDETEDVQQREELRISNERLRMAASAIQLGVWELTLEGPRNWDEGMLNIYGITRDEFDKITSEGPSSGIWDKYVHPNDRHRPGEVLRAAWSKDRRFDVQYRIIRPDGDIRTVRSAGVVMPDSNGVLRAVGITMDITAEVRAAERLREAKNAAESANIAKSRFLATMSHEIRTPLNSVIGLANLLGDTPLNGLQQDYLNTIRTSGESLLSVVSDVLDFSKIEEGSLVLERSEFNLRTIVEEAVELVAESARAKGLRLQIAMRAESEVNVIGDPGRLRQVLLNLLSNAVKFTMEGSIGLQVASEGKGLKDRYRFAVVDTGIGIAEENRNHLFRAFSQGDSSITRSFGGTGLGLAISESFVHLMGGEIGVISKLGQGSTFWFTANFERGGPVVAQAPIELLQGQLALIVDGDAVTSKCLRGQLEELGLRVGWASNALEALSLCSLAAAGNDPYTVLFVNPQLPVMDGWKLASVMRSQADGKKLAIIMVSDRHFPAREQAGDNPADGHLLQPVQRRVLVRTLRKALGERRGTEGLVAEARPAPPPRRGTILLVEDNGVNQKVATAALRRLGYEVELAADGIAAVEAFRPEKYDAILMDCHMPRMDGYAATAEIRKVEGNRCRTPIIALTADVLEAGRQKCLASGLDDFLSKPIRMDLLERTLEFWRSVENVDTN